MLKLKTTDIRRSASAADVVHQSLRDAIVHGDLVDGEVLRQDQIASMFGVSRIPVREALTRLESQGLIDYHRYRGAVVSSLSLDEIAETHEFRALVETEVIRRSIRKVTDDTLAIARHHAAEFAATSDSAEWARTNRLFHLTLYRDCGQPYHLEIVGNALDKIARYLRAQLVLTGGIEKAVREHDAILTACESRDADLAADLTKAHILGASRSLLLFLEAQRSSALVSA